MACRWPASCCVLAGESYPSRPACCPGPGATPDLFGPSLLPQASSPALGFRAPIQESGVARLPATVASSGALLDLSSAVEEQGLPHGRDVATPPCRLLLCEDVGSALANAPFWCWDPGQATEGHSLSLDSARWEGGPGGPGPVPPHLEDTIGWELPLSLWCLGTCERVPPPQGPRLAWPVVGRPPQAYGPRPVAPGSCPLPPHHPAPTCGQASAQHLGAARCVGARTAGASPGRKRADGRTCPRFPSVPDVPWGS